MASSHTRRRTRRQAGPKMHDLPSRIRGAPHPRQPTSPGAVPAGRLATRGGSPLALRSALRMRVRTPNGLAAQRLGAARGPSEAAPSDAARIAAPEQPRGGEARGRAARRRAWTPPRDCKCGGPARLFAHEARGWRLARGCCGFRLSLSARGGLADRDRFKQTRRGWPVLCRKEGSPKGCCRVELTRRARFETSSLEGKSRRLASRARRRQNRPVASLASGAPGAASSPAPQASGASSTAGARSEPAEPRPESGVWERNGNRFES